MPKNSFYFPHDYNAHNDPKIVRLSMKGWDLVGLYWSIVGMLHEQDGWLPNDCDTIAFALRADKERITTLINFPDLFIIDGKRFTTQRVLNNLKIMHNKREKATISALKRWNNAKAMPTHSEGNAIKKEEKEKKVSITAFKPPNLDEVITYKQETSSPVDPQDFIDFYSSKGWKVGKESMKDWKASFRRAKNWDKYLTGAPKKWDI